MFLEVQLDTIIKGRDIKFRKGITITEGTIQVPTLLSTITFHIVPADTPFLLYI